MRMILRTELVFFNRFNPPTLIDASLLSGKLSEQGSNGGITISSCY